MQTMLSKEDVDKELALNAHQMREQFINFHRGLGTGMDTLMVNADCKLEQLRLERNKILLRQGVTCGEEYCKKTRLLSQWKFFFGGEGNGHLVEKSAIQCPCCGYTDLVSEHPMSSRIIWLVTHAYLSPEKFLPNVEIGHVASRHSPCLG